MYVDELIAATLGDRTIAAFNRAAGEPVTAARMRDIAAPDEVWKNFLVPATALGIARASGASMKAVLHAQSWSIARYLGIPEIAVVEEESRLLSLMPTGTKRLRPQHLDAILAVIRVCMDDAARLDEIDKQIA